jgi:hypothetical protein
MWASEPSQSHVLTADALRATITATGFIVRAWNPAVRFPEPPANAASAALTIQRLIMGERLPAIREAGARNTAEDRLRSVLAVCERP